MATSSTDLRYRRLKSAVLLAIVELLAIVITYQLVASIECRLTEAELACRALRSLPARAFAIFALVFLFFRIRPKSYHHLGEMLEAKPGRRRWLALHGLGLVLIFLPLMLFGAEQMNRSITPSLGLMLLGGVLTATGLLLWLSPLRNWAGWLKSDHYYLPLTLLSAALVPDLAEALRPVWTWASISDATFFLVFLTLTLFSSDIGVDPQIYAIGVEGFNVTIGIQCAGVEGVALIAIFMALYATLMRGDIRQNRYWLVLFPLAILTSWLFNILRITVLILIGARLSPEHALNGFHSYAGWLLFTCLALAILVTAHGIRWFHTASDPKPDGLTLWQDPTAAQIVPFIVMMLSGVVAAVIWSTPETGHPLRAAAMAVGLLGFWRYLKQLDWSLDPVALLVGGIVAAGWIALADSGMAEPHAPAWIAIRIFGTVALVPVIEELFFRGYVLRRLDWGGPVMRFVAVAVSSGLFGLMHDRFFAGTAAGVVFALLYLRRGRVTDAIGAHIAANAVVALWALIQSDWSLI